MGKDDLVVVAVRSRGFGRCDSWLSSYVAVVEQDYAGGGPMSVHIMWHRRVALFAFLGFASVLPIAVSYGLTQVASTNASSSPAGKFAVVAANLARDGLSGDPAPDAPLAYPEGTRTGIPAIDSVLAALDAPLPDRLQALFVKTPSPVSLQRRRQV